VFVLVHSFQQIFLTGCFSQRHLLYSSFLLSLGSPISNIFETFHSLHHTLNPLFLDNHCISFRDTWHVIPPVECHSSLLIHTCNHHRKQEYAFTFAMATSYASGLDISSWNYNDHTNLQIPLGINCMVSIILVLMLILLRLCVRFSNGNLGHDDCK
jgi:hypothetical protein